MGSGENRLRGDNYRPSLLAHAPDRLAGSVARTPTPGFPWQDSHLARARLQDTAIPHCKSSLTLSSSKAQIRRLQMVPLTDCSCHQALGMATSKTSKTAFCLAALPHCLVPGLAVADRGQPRALSCSPMASLREVGHRVPLVTKLF